MSEKKIRLRINDVADDNSILLKNELGYKNNQLKIGDNETKWTDLSPMLILNIKDGIMPGTITTNSGDETVETGLNVDNGSYSAVFGRYLKNYAGYSLLSGYNNKNYGRDNVVVGLQNEIGTAIDITKLTEQARIEYENTGWTSRISINGLNSDGTVSDVGDKLAFNPKAPSRNIVCGYDNILYTQNSIIGGTKIKISGQPNRNDRNLCTISNMLIVGSNITLENTTSVNSSCLIGIGLRLNNAFHGTQCILGRYNDPNANNDAIFVVGCGTSGDKRKNAIIVREHYSTHEQKVEIPINFYVNGTTTLKNLSVVNITSSGKITTTRDILDTDEDTTVTTKKYVLGKIETVQSIMDTLTSSVNSVTLSVNNLSSNVLSVQNTVNTLNNSYETWTFEVENDDGSIETITKQVLIKQ